MAKDRKSAPTPVNLETPKALVPIMKAFSADSKKTAKALIVETIQTIYQPQQQEKKWIFSDQELDGVVSLIQSLQPKDALQTLYAAQMVICHLVGLKKLSQHCSDDQRIGVRLLRWSSKFMDIIVKKQSSHGGY